jgi:hypothetical protein
MGLTVLIACDKIIPDAYKADILVTPSFISTAIAISTLAPFSHLRDIIHSNDSLIHFSFLLRKIISFYFQSCASNSYQEDCELVIWYK